jgi:hypothetical protein
MKLIAVPALFEIKTASPVNDVNPVPPWPTARVVESVTVPVTSKSPVTVKLSSTVVSPVAESIVNPPDTVSISLSPVIPIWILPKSAPVP